MKETINWRERLPKTNSSGRQCLPIYFFLITSNPMLMLIFYWCSQYYATLISIFEFLNSCEDCENIHSRTSSDVPEEFCNSESDNKENVLTTKMGYCQKLRPLEEFFIVLCCLRGGFSEGHFANLNGVAQATVSRSFIQCINFMYLKLRQICIWPSTCKAVVQHKSCLLIVNEQGEQRWSACEAASLMPRKVLQQAEKFSIMLWKV